MREAVVTREKKDLLIPASGLLGVGAIALAIWLRMDPVAFQGGDGKGFQTYILNYVRFGAPFEVNVLNPLQGDFAPQLPLNTWLNPGYVVFRLFAWDRALVASLVTSWFALAIPTYVLGRATGLSALPAAFAAQATIFAFPPFLFLFGFNTQYMLVPPTAVTVGLQTLALASLVRLRVPSGLNVIGCGLSVAGILYASLVIDPVFFVAGLASLIPLVGVMGLETGTPRVVGARILALLLALLVLYVVGGIEYLVNLIKFTARDFFKPEIGRAQVPADVSMLFMHPRDFGRTILFLGAGWLLGAFLCRGPRRFFAMACLLHWIFLIVQGVAYLFVNVEWPSIAPMYLEQAAYHFYILGAVSGWSALLERCAASLVRSGHAGSGFAAGGSLALLSVAPLALAWYLSEAAGPSRSAYSEPWPNEVPLLEMLRAQLAPRQQSDEVRAFPGSVAILEPVDGYQKVLMMTLLWREGIPTLNEYSQLVTPSTDYFSTRLLLGPGHTYVGLNGYFLRIFDPRILALMGARFALVREDNQLVPAATRIPIRNTTHGPTRWSLYEIPSPNLGNYSPTEVHRTSKAHIALSLMRSRNLDFRHAVIVDDAESLPPLTPAKSVTAYFGRGSLRVAAESPDDSLLVLPVQFSHCLKLVGSGNARLVRTDLAFAGLLFHGSTDSRIDFHLRFIDSECRKADREDLITRGYAADPDYYIADHLKHPFAVRAPREITARLEEVASQVGKAYEADESSRVPLSGPITRTVRRWFGGVAR